jgi:ribose-phosphate pyrophosphokinase
VLNKHFLDMNIPPEDLAVVSPDAGSIKRAVGHVKRLGGQLAIVDKRRGSPTDTQQEHIIGGPLEDKVALIFDDMISTAGSICGAARAVAEAGAREIHVAVSHAVLCGNAAENIKNSPITALTITDSIPLAPEHQLEKVQTLTVAPLLAEAIRRIHHDQSISSMFDYG